jgi:hypothetical protein
LDPHSTPRLGPTSNHLSGYENNGGPGAFISRPPPSQQKSRGKVDKWIQMLCYQAWAPSPVPVV